MSPVEAVWRGVAARARALWARAPRQLRERPALVAAAAVAALVAGLVAGGGDEGAGPLGIGSFDPAVVDATPLDGRSPREPAGERQRVIVALSRPALGEREGAGELSARAQRRYVASLRDESRSLRSALGARGVQLRDVVEFERVFNGFAATVDSRDLPGLSSLGVRPEPVRRFFPVLSEPVAAAGEASTGPAPTSRGIVAVLAGGADTRHPALRGRVVRGYDAVDGDRSPAPGPDPRDESRLEHSGTALAGAVVAAGARARPLRVSALRAGPEGVDEHATTDTLIAGLERAADPDGDGDTSDHDDAALVGVNAPYAGFSDSPEAAAVAAATSLGMPVVAPSGGEGAGRAGAGTVGSPAAAADTVAVAALGAPEALPRVDLDAGDVEAPGAMLAGFGDVSQIAYRRVEIPDPDAFLRDPPPLRGRAAIVEAGPLPTAQAAAAAAAGAQVVVLAAPGERTLTAIPAGRVSVKVVGVTGDAAEALLESEETGTLAIGAAGGGDLAAGEALAPAASRGPTLDGLGKPTFAAPGAAVVPVPRAPDGLATVGGGAIAAARVAANIALGRGAESAGAISLDPPDPGPVPDPVPLGVLRLLREQGTVTGVRFAVGAFERGDPFGDGSLIRAATRLDLALVDEGEEVVRRLTPPGGARGLLPGEYSYTLPKATLGALGAGTYAFRATARTPRRDVPTRRTSDGFSPR